MNRGSACDGWSPIVVTAKAYAAMTDEDRRAVTKHNEHGEHVCGWEGTAMTIAEIALWSGFALSVVTFIYTVVTNRGKANSDTQAVLAGKIDIVEDRVTRIETDFKHLPDARIVHSVQLSIERLSADVKVLGATLKPVAAIADRMQEEMLERART